MLFSIISQILTYTVMLLFVILFFFGIYKLFANLIYILKNIKMYKYLFKTPLKAKDLVQNIVIVLLLFVFIYEIYLFAFGKVELGGCSGVREYRFDAKKALSGLNQAVTLNYALEGKVYYDNVDEFAGMLANRMSIINDKDFKYGIKYLKNSDKYEYSEYSKKEITEGNLSNYIGKPIFTTAADGIMFMFEKFEAGCKIVDEVNPDNSDCIIVIDVNGFKKHNKMTEDYNHQQDRYKFVIDGNQNRIFPLHKVMQDVIYDRPHQNEVQNGR